MRWRDRAFFMPAPGLPSRRHSAEIILSNQPFVQYQRAQSAMKNRVILHAGEAGHAAEKPNG
jgi:hypothetical protein